MSLEQATPQSKPKAKRWKSYIQVLVSAGLLGVIYFAVDFKKLLYTLSSLSFGSALILITLYAVGQVLSAIKWNMFVRNVGIRRPVEEVVRAYFFGMFVNSVGFGLGTVGGDVARGLALFPERGQRAAALSTVVADRLHGLGVLLLIGIVSMLIVRPEPVSGLIMLLCSAALLAICALWVFGPWLLQRSIAEGHGFSEPARQIARAFPRDPRTIAVASFLSVGVHMVQIAMHVIIAHHLGASLSAAYLFATVPLVNVASSLPISFNGIGVREFMYTWLFSPFVSREVGVAFGAIWLFTVTVVGMLGGLLLTPEMRRAAEEERIRRGTVVPLPLPDEAGRRQISSERRV